ncbi:MAG: sigma 54-interacting transcriptional regulator, partial [Gemmatimonadales bacterium]
LADNGTLFLDEIGNVPAKQQAKLLRVIETGELQRVGSSKIRKVDVRVVSATNMDIEAAVANGVFREDLLYRLNTVEINLPPLCERPEDIPPLAAYYLARHAAKYDKNAIQFGDQAMRALVQHPWPGNVRELSHVLERAVLMAQDDVVQVTDLGLRSRGDTGSGVEGMTLEDAERMMIERALARFDGNVSRAAETLGLSRSALYRRMQRFDL